MGLKYNFTSVSSDHFKTEQLQLLGSDHEETLKRTLMNLEKMDTNDGFRKIQKRLWHMTIMNCIKGKVHIEID